MRLKGVRVFVLGFCCLLIGASDVFAAGKTVSIVETLNTQASAELIRKNFYEKPGVWQEDRFFFPGQSRSVNIGRREVLWEGEERPAIMVRPLGGYTQRLIFRDVSQSSSAVFYLKSNAIRGTDETSSGAVYVRIWLGKKPIERVRISPEDGWKKVKIDLGGVRFLPARVSMILDVTTDVQQGLELNVFGNYRKL